MNYKTFPRAVVFCLAGVFAGYYIPWYYKMQTHRNVIVEPYIKNKEFSKKLLEKLTEYDVRQTNNNSEFLSRTDEKIIYIDKNSSLIEKRKKIIKNILASENISEKDLDEQTKNLYNEIFGDSK